MKADCCPSHPGIKIDRHPCYRCEPAGARSPLLEVVNQLRQGVDALTIPEEVPVAPPLASVSDTVTADGAPLDAITAAIEKAAADTWRQPSLSDTLFPPVRRADVPMVKITLSGTIELTQEQYQSYLDGGTLGPGAVVDVRALGYVVQPGAAWVKRTEGSGEDRQTWHEREGRIQIKLVDLGALAATGEEWAS